jgi:hypothetical protein
MVVRLLTGTAPKPGWPGQRFRERRLGGNRDLENGT